MHCVLRNALLKSSSQSVNMLEEELVCLLYAKVPCKVIVEVEFRICACQWHKCIHNDL